jgi:hypothetical protein
MSNDHDYGNLTREPEFATPKRARPRPNSAWSSTDAGRIGPTQKMKNSWAPRKTPVQSARAR